MIPEGSDPVFDAEEIDSAVVRIAHQLNSDCAGGVWLLLAVMNGAVVFAADLMSRLTFAHELDSVRVSRYHGETTGGELIWHASPTASLDGANILLIDDIFDEGHTLHALHKHLVTNGAATVRSVVLLDKQHERKVEGFEPDYVGLRCPDRYVFGYGLDYEGRWRHLPEVYALLEADGPR